MSIFCKQSLNFSQALLRPISFQQNKRFLSSSQEKSLLITSADRLAIQICEAAFTTMGITPNILSPNPEQTEELLKKKNISFSQIFQHDQRSEEELDRLASFLVQLPTQTSIIHTANPCLNFDPRLSFETSQKKKPSLWKRFFSAPDPFEETNRIFRNHKIYYSALSTAELLSAFFWTSDEKLERSLLFVDVDQDRKLDTPDSNIKEAYSSRLTNLAREHRTYASGCYSKIMRIPPDLKENSDDLSKLANEIVRLTFEPLNSRDGQMNIINDPDHDQESSMFEENFVFAKNLQLLNLARCRQLLSKSSKSS